MASFSAIPPPSSVSLLVFFAMATTLIAFERGGGLLVNSPLRAFSGLVRVENDGDNNNNIAPKLAQQEKKGKREKPQAVV
ncbi:hypothetical protein SOVF_015530 [Spinacia oleracea]|nr:hypothetical protein SOVF_015530 [Spinacia oleracea]